MPLSRLQGSHLVLYASCSPPKAAIPPAIPCTRHIPYTCHALDTCHTHAMHYRLQYHLPCHALHHRTPCIPLQCHLSSCLFFVPFVPSPLFVIVISYCQSRSLFCEFFSLISFLLYWTFYHLTMSSCTALSYDTPCMHLRHYDLTCHQLTSVPSCRRSFTSLSPLTPSFTVHAIAYYSTQKQRHATS